MTRTLGFELHLQASDEVGPWVHRSWGGSPLGLSPVPVLCGAAGLVLVSPSAPLPSAGSLQGSRPRQQPGARFPSESPWGICYYLICLSWTRSPLISPSPPSICFPAQSKPFRPVSHCLQKAGLPWVPGTPSVRSPVLPTYSFWAQCMETQPRTGWKHPWKASWRRWHSNWASKDVGGN